MKGKSHTPEQIERIKAKRKRVRTLQVEQEEMNEYGSFFRSMRKSIGFNLKRMAQELDIHYTTLSKWEKGLIIPRNDIYLIVETFRRVVKENKVS